MEEGHSSTEQMGLNELLGHVQEELYRVPTRAPGPPGRLPLTADILKNWASGDLFGLSQNVGMGWNPAKVLAPPVLIMSTQGGIRITMVGRWLSAITPVIGKLDGLCGSPRRRFATWALCRMQAWSVTRAMGGVKGHRPCMIRFPIETTPHW